MAKIYDITDFSAPELDVYARLTENQLVNRADPANALFIAESPLVIGRALDAGCEPVSFLMERRHIEGKASDILARCPDDIPVYAAELEVLTQLTGFHLTRGMLCAMRRPALPSVAELCTNAARVAVLENVMNPTNIGAIFRSAAALGVDAVLLTSAGSDPLYRRAVRVSMGTVFQVPWTYLPADTDWQETLHALGFRTAAMALRDDSLRIDDARLRTLPRLAIVLGTEGGMDVIGMMLIKKGSHTSIGHVNLFWNMALYAICAAAFNLSTAIYSILFSFISTTAMDKLHMQNINVEVTVVTKILSPEMEHEILVDLHRGITRYEGIGEYTGEPVHIFYILVTKYEISRLRAIVCKHDPHAFIVAKDGAVVYGNYKRKL